MNMKPAHNIPVLGVILAGGRATRMGGKDKFLLELHDGRIIDHIMRRLTPQVGKLVLNVNNPDTRDKVHLEIVPDLPVTDHPIGPMGGLYSSLFYAKQNGFQKMLTVPGDTPFIPDNFLEKLSYNKNHSIAVAQSNGRRHPLSGLWDVSILTDLKAAIDNRNYKMMDFINGQKVTIVEWNEDPDPFFNINTESDLEVAKQLYCSG